MKIDDIVIGETYAIDDSYETARATWGVGLKQAVAVEIVTVEARRFHIGRGSTEKVQQRRILFRRCNDGFESRLTGAACLCLWSEYETAVAARQSELDEEDARAIALADIVAEAFGLAQIPRVNITSFGSASVGFTPEQVTAVLNRRYLA